jgi:hypothetical protein
MALCKKLKTIYFVYVATIKYRPGIVGQTVAINMGFTDLPEGNFKIMASN